MTVATSAEGKNPLAVARARVEAALKKGYDKLAAPHAAWWARFWQRSSLDGSRSAILQQYYLVRYFYGAASRRGAPPMPLQGVWSADAGSLPPWKGDYHNDLNTQMTYIAYRTSGDFEEGACFLDYLWDRLPAFRKFARDFYDAPGAAVPGVMSLAGATARRLGPIQPLAHYGRLERAPVLSALASHRRRRLSAGPRLSVLQRDRHLPARAAQARAPTACCGCRSPARPRSSTTRAAPSSSPTATTTSPA